MENNMEHFLPTGQIEFDDKISICHNSHLCETCNSFLYSLCLQKIEYFFSDQEYTEELSSIRIMIPIKKENINHLSMEGIEHLLSEISVLELEGEKGHIKWDRTRSMMTITPIFLDEISVGLCLDIFLKPTLNIFEVYFLEVRLNEIQEKYPLLKIEFRDELINYVLTDEFLDKQVGSVEIPMYLEMIDGLLTPQQLDELKFIMCWGVFDVNRKKNGDWFIPMFELNQKHFNENKPVDNDPFSLEF